MFSTSCENLIMSIAICDNFNSVADTQFSEIIQKNTFKA